MGTYSSIRLIKATGKLKSISTRLWLSMLRLLFSDFVGPPVNIRCSSLAVKIKLNAMICSQTKQSTSCSMPRLSKMYMHLSFRTILLVSLFVLAASTEKWFSHLNQALRASIKSVNSSSAVQFTIWQAPFHSLLSAWLSSKYSGGISTTSRTIISNRLLLTRISSRVLSVHSLALEILKVSRLLLSKDDA